MEEDSDDQIKDNPEAPLSVKSKSDLNLNTDKKKNSWTSLRVVKDEEKGRPFKHSITMEEVVPHKSRFFDPGSTDEEEENHLRTKEIKSRTLNLSSFTSKQRGKQKEDRKLSKSVRRYYKDQDQLIESYKHIKQNNTTIIELDETHAIDRASQLAKISFGCNLFLLIGKTVAAAISGSLAVITSVIDSVVDLVSGALMWWSSRAIKKRDPYLYPQGRTKLEPVSIIVLSVVMALASLFMIRQSVEVMVDYVIYDMQDPIMHNLTANYCLTIPQMYDYGHTRGAHGPVFEWDSMCICLATVAIKFILYLVCRRYNFPATRALAQDHRNDVISNSGAMLSGWIGYKYWKYADPIGAILISLYIIYSWYRTGNEQIKLLTGHTAQPGFLKKLTWMAVTHHEKILYIDTLRAFHFGNNFLVEVDIVLPGDMTVIEAHDIGETLQMKLESIPEVERAFVHIDHEAKHHPTQEHKIV